MDAMTYALAKPKVIDLTKYSTTDGYKFNDLLLTMLLGSLENNGGMQTRTVQDANQSLRKVLSTNKQILLATDTGDVISKYPATLTTSKDGVALQCTFNGVMYMDGVTLEMKSIILFQSDPASDTVQLYVQGTPITVA